MRFTKTIVGTTLLFALLCAFTYPEEALRATGLDLRRSSSFISRLDRICAFDSQQDATAGEAPTEESRAAAST